MGETSILELLVVLFGVAAALGVAAATIALQRAARAAAMARREGVVRRAFVELVDPPPRPHVDTLVSRR